MSYYKIESIAETARIKKELGLRIFVVRDLAGMTQDELAKQIGLSRTQITNIEAGISDIPVSRLIKIANALSVKPAKLLPSIK